MKLEISRGERSLGKNTSLGEVRIFSGTMLHTLRNFLYS